MPKATKASREVAVAAWCFTLNNYSDEEYSTTTANICGAKPVFGVVARERGDSGTPHLQGFVHFSSRLRLLQVKEIIGTRAHVEKARGSDLENLTYCSKDDPQPWSVGKPALHSSRRGKPADLHRSVNEFLDLRQDDVPIHQIFTQNEGAGLAFLSHQKAIQSLEKDRKRAHIIDHERSLFATSVLRRYQSRLLGLVDKDPDPRKIHWYYDDEGNTGKSWFTRYLIAMRGAQRFSNAKSADIAYALDNPKIVVFDFSRSQQEHINYSIIEDIKNGVVFSPKYESCTKMFRSPHVICFANWICDGSKMSADRWDVCKIKPEDCEEDIQQLLRIDTLVLDNLINTNNKDSGHYEIESGWFNDDFSID